MNLVPITIATELKSQTFGAERAEVEWELLRSRSFGFDGGVWNLEGGSACGGLWTPIQGSE